MQALNNRLYQALESRIPGGVQHVTHPGDPGRAFPERQPGGRRHFKIVEWGEGYDVACPFCGDRGKHLRVNHRYGQADPTAQRARPMTHLAKCFRNDCLKDGRNRDAFARLVLGTSQEPIQAPSHRMARTEAPPTPLPHCHPPGVLIPLNALPDDHPATGYLLLRRFDRQTFRDFDLSYCEKADPANEIVEGRIVVPIDFRGCRVGWQARLPHTPRDGGPPRYVTMPGLPKGQLLYNLDRASRQPFIVLVEGVTDVWRLGSMAVSGFGKDLSDQQVCLLREASQAGARQVVILLDGGETVAAWKAKRALNRAQVPTVTVDLPAGLDPADYPNQDALLQEICRQATAQGVELPPPGVGQ